MKSSLLPALFVIFACALVSCRDTDPAPVTPPVTPETTESASAESSAPASPSAAAAVPIAGVSHGTLRHNNLDRTYRLYVPAGLATTQKVSLVVGLHGGLGWGDQFASNSRFEATAQSEGFIAVFPDGIERTWNGGGCCGMAARRNIDDVGFLVALIEDLATRLPIDRSRVFMTGHSNGGIMSFRFGCERPDLVRAIAPVAGSLEIPACNASVGTSLLAIHGDADQNHPLEGGQGPRSIAGVPFVSMDTSLARWTKGMECEAAPDHQTAGAITSTTWVACRDNVKATFMVIADADHPWPGGTGSAVGGRASQALDATPAIWAFFETLER